MIHRNMTPDFVDHDGPGGRPAGIDGDERMMLGMYEAMPDLRLTIVEMIAEQWIRDRHPHHRVERFLTVFSLPAYFPAPAT